MSVHQSQMQAMLNTSLAAPVFVVESPKQDYDFAISFIVTLKR